MWSLTALPVAPHQSCAKKQNEKPQNARWEVISFCKFNLGLGDSALPRAESEEK